MAWHSVQEWQLLAGRSGRRRRSSWHSGIQPHILTSPGSHPHLSPSPSSSLHSYLTGPLFVIHSSLGVENVCLYQVMVVLPFIIFGGTAFSPHCFIPLSWEAVIPLCLFYSFVGSFLLLHGMAHAALIISFCLFVLEL